MEKSDVRIVKLEAMRLASVWGFGETPETLAWQKLEAFAKPRGLWGDLQAHRIFGFNNPNPSHGSPKYGYELWIEVAPEVEPVDDVRIVDFPGGLYAAMRCEVPRGGAYEVIGETWKRLAAWLEAPHGLSHYRMGSHQWLEQSVTFDDPGVEFALDLLLPIVE